MFAGGFFVVFFWFGGGFFGSVWGFVMIFRFGVGFLGRCGVFGFWFCWCGFLLMHGQVG